MKLQYMLAMQWNSFEVKLNKYVRRNENILPHYPETLGLKIIKMTCKYKKIIIYLYCKYFLPVCFNQK